MNKIKMAVIAVSLIALLVACGDTNPNPAYSYKLGYIDALADIQKYYMLNSKCYPKDLFDNMNENVHKSLAKRANLLKIDDLNYTEKMVIFDNDIKYIESN